jgi:hypothetical protein
MWLPYHGIKRRITLVNDTPLTDDVWSLDRPNARRSLILCAAGALIGLGIAGLGLFTAQGTRTATVPAEDVALVNQVPILMSDYVQQLRTLYDVSLSQATLAQRHKALADMIREELYVQRGVELGMQADTIEVRTALVGAVEAQSAADATMAQPSEEELRTWYQQHSDQFASEGEMELADHILPREATPLQVAAALAGLKAGHAGAAPLSGKMQEGREFYFAAKIHLGDALFAAARLLDSGQVSVPVALPDSIHILVMKSNRQPTNQPLEQIRDRVLAAYVDDQAKRLNSANERFLQKRADVQVAKGYE